MKPNFTERLLEKDFILFNETLILYKYFYEKSVFLAGQDLLNIFWIKLDYNTIKTASKPYLLVITVIFNKCHFIKVKLICCMVVLRVSETQRSIKFATKITLKHKHCKACIAFNKIHFVSLRVAKSAWYIDACYAVPISLIDHNHKALLNGLKAMCCIV